MRRRSELDEDLRNECYVALDRCDQAVADCVDDMMEIARPLLRALGIEGYE